MLQATTEIITCQKLRLAERRPNPLSSNDPAESIPQSWFVLRDNSFNSEVTKPCQHCRSKCTRMTVINLCLFHFLHLTSMQNFRWTCTTDVQQHVATHEQLPHQNRLEKAKINVQRNPCKQKADKNKAEWSQNWEMSVCLIDMSKMLTALMTKTIPLTWTLHHKRMTCVTSLWASRHQQEAPGVERQLGWRSLQQVL